MKWLINRRRKQLCWYSTFSWLTPKWLSGTLCSGKGDCMFKYRMVEWPMDQKKRKYTSNLRIQNCKVWLGKQSGICLINFLINYLLGYKQFWVFFTLSLSDSFMQCLFKMPTLTAFPETGKVCPNLPPPKKKKKREGGREKRLQFLNYACDFNAFPNKNKLQMLCEITFA